MKKFYITLFVFFLSVFSTYGSAIHMENAVVRLTSRRMQQTAALFCLTGSTSGSHLRKGSIQLPYHSTNPSALLSRTSNAVMTDLNSVPCTIKETATNKQLKDINHTPRVVLITGASGDIGIELTKNFILKGDFVIGQYSRNIEALSSLRDAYPSNVALVECEFDTPENIQDFWRKVLEIRDHVDVLINSAGVEIEDTSLAQSQRTMNINYLSPRLLCDLAIDSFRRMNRSGIIVNMGSRAAYRGLPKGYYTYADSKSALTRYSQSIAKDNAPWGVSVYVVAPGPVEGKMFQGLNEDIKAQCLSSMPTGKPVKVQEVVAMVDLLASGKVPSATGGVFDLMGASWTH